MKGVILGLILTAVLGCNRKDPPPSEIASTHAVMIDSMASFAVLQEIEAEDPYLSASLTPGDIEGEIEKRAAALTRQADANQDGRIDLEEEARLKSLISDRMLELFDVDSDGQFSKAERQTILEKIQVRIETAKNRFSSPKL